MAGRSCLLAASWSRSHPGRVILDILGTVAQVPQHMLEYLTGLHLV